MHIHAFEGLFCRIKRNQDFYIEPYIYFEFLGTICRERTARDLYDTGKE
jgi:hypothetical protein